jgi:dTDP-4-amino-4,6-dideoxygalactose transaminase
MEYIRFNRPFVTGRELEYIQQVIAEGHISGNGAFTRRCEAWLQERTGCVRALLTPSCTAALELAALLIDIGPGDEVIMPSYTFVSTANAFVLRGGVPVFVDVRPDTFNLAVEQIEAAITARTRAIVPVHYAGVGCDMEPLLEIAHRHGLAVIEDAAQALMSTYRGRALGTFGRLGAVSFHETKDVMCGEGGALLINDPALVDRAEVIRDKGTNRSQFFRGQVDKYTWVDLGSSYSLSDLNAAFLMAQLEQAEWIVERRLHLWQRYHAGLAELEQKGKLRRPVVPPDCRPNAHMYSIVLPSLAQRSALIAALEDAGIQAVFHYVALHSSPGGERYGRAHGTLPETSRASDCLVRLPLWIELGDEAVDRVVEQVRAALSRD